MITNKYKPKAMRQDDDLGNIKEIAKRLHQLTMMEENGQINYNGADLNILDRIQEKIDNETITDKDIFELEKLAFKFL